MIMEYMQLQGLSPAVRDSASSQRPDLQFIVWLAPSTWSTTKIVADLPNGLDRLLVAKPSPHLV